MKLIPCEAPERVRKQSKLFETLVEFAESEYDFVEIVDYTQSSAKVCVTAFSAAIKKYRMYTIGVMQRKEHVYLYKKNT